MDKSQKSTRRPSFRQKPDTNELQKNQEKTSTDSKTNTQLPLTPRMMSHAQKTNTLLKTSPPDKSSAEKQPEMKIEIASLGSRKPSSPLLLSSREVEANYVPFLPDSPYKESIATFATSSVVTTAEASNVSNTTELPQPVALSKLIKSVSSKGAVRFDLLDEDSQNIIRKNNGVITNPKDLAHLFLSVETNCGNEAPNINKKMNFSGMKFTSPVFLKNLEMKLLIYLKSTGDFWLKSHSIMMN